MSEPAAGKPLSRYARAETGTRQALLLVSMGVLSMVVGKLIESQLTIGAGEELANVTSDTAAFAITWTLGRLWLFLVLPPVAFLVARFMSVGGVNFAIVGGLSGETFLLLMDLAIGGSDFAFPTAADTVARAVTLGLGIGLAALAGRKGEALAAASQERARLEAEKTKADYAAMLERATAGAAAGSGEAKPVAPADGAVGGPAGAPQDGARGAGGGGGPQPDATPGVSGGSRPGPDRAS